MRTALPILAVVLAAGLLWFVFRSEDSAQEDVEYTESGEATADGGSATLLQGTKRQPGQAPAPKRRKGLDPRTAPRGTLTVIPVDTDDNPIPASRVRVTVEPEGRSWPSSPLGHRDLQTNAWEFRNLFTGPVRIVCSGDTYLRTVVKANVTVRDQKPVRVRVQPGGAIHWLVNYENGGTPDKLTLEVLRDGKPTTAWFEERHLKRISSRRHAKKVTLGHAGYVTGLKAGTYTFRATNTEGFHREAVVDVVLGSIADVRLSVRDTADAEPPPQPPPAPPPRNDPDPDSVPRNPDAGPPPPDKGKKDK